MRKNVAVLQQLKQWADELQEVRDQFAIGLNPGQAFADFDRILQEIKEFILHSSNE